MDVKWFEMQEIIKRDFNKNVWTTLYSSQKNFEGDYGHEGYYEEYIGIVSVLFPEKDKNTVLKFSWSDISSISENKPIIIDDVYFESDIYDYYNSIVKGQFLVMRQIIDCESERNFYLHQDLVLALGLVKENDSWICPEEDYNEVVRMIRDSSNKIIKIEIKTEYLKDYLCARNSGVLISTYQARRHFSTKKLALGWESNNVINKFDNGRWEGHITEMQEGGNPLDSGAKVFHIHRTDVDFDDDVPQIEGPPTDDNLISKSWVVENTAPLINYYWGEVWKNEWIERSEFSPRVRGDKIRSNVHFIIDATGKTKNSDDFVEEGGWLWFRPNLINELLSKRKPVLSWYTENTGKVGGAQNKSFHFGMNDLGLINIFAYDITFLPEYHKKIWAAYNISPEGKVCKELLMSQVDANPAITLAPEAVLFRIVDALDAKFKAKYGMNLFRQHNYQENINLKIHRFLVLNKEDIFKLSKELTKFIIERMDYDNLNKLIPKELHKVGTIKKLENILNILGLKGREMTSVLVGVYDLRQGETHLPSSDFSDAFKLVKLNLNQPFPLIGKEIIKNVSDCLFSIYENIPDS